MNKIGMRCTKVRVEMSMVRKSDQAVTDAKCIQERERAQGSGG